MIDVWNTSSEEMALLLVILLIPGSVHFSFRKDMKRRFLFQQASSRHTNDSGIHKQDDEQIAIIPIQTLQAILRVSISSLPLSVSPSLVSSRLL